MRLVIVAASVLTLTGCSQGAGGGGTAAAVYDTTLTMAEVMGHVLDPAADVIWGAAGTIDTLEGTQDLAPTTDEGWLAVENGAATVIEAGNVLLTEPRVVDEPEWRNAVKQMQTAALASMKSAEAKDKDGVFQHGAELYQACVACHQRYTAM